MREGQPEAADEGNRPAQQGTQETPAPLSPGAPPSDSVRSRAPWSGLLIVLVWMSAEVWLGLAVGLLGATGWFGDVLAGPASTLARARLAMWANCLALPPRLASVVFLARAVCQAGPDDLGLTTRRLGRNLLLGLAAAVVLAPLVYGLQFLLEGLTQQLSHSGVQQHPFTLLAREGLSRVEWLGLILAAVVAAPLWEELLFRGLIQPWVIDRPAGGPISLGLACLLGVLLRWDRLAAASLVGTREVLVELIPALLVLLLLPVYLLLRYRFRSPVAAGIFATSVLFGWFHVGVWPSPIALALLSLGLGWLAFKGHSLVGPFTLHAIFNAVACVLLVFA